MIETKQSLDIRGALASITKVSKGLDAMAQRAVEHVIPHDREPNIQRRKAEQKDLAA
ncbi:MULTISPECIES: hypothetical protein [unclassified Rhizobium]|uniref:hypothetical protein n=1 Tax=unclassified Rhizobium TaxID=2613769 RepID=UPI001ADC68FA|nr:MULTISPECIES: hypothetical protein [unclassified Rhizobium]MBO9099466.1 hypothetical protein [Rhizobium sp. L58/93]QXZ87051.1 hypothetical protein J5287_20900 [Rhizobium sp. K1/93]QXZ92915.1 hypothetical protein J5280_19995 [Rhizobium sp. K15/93]